MASPRHLDQQLVIVGGGPAGLSLALHLARLEPAAASRLVVLERGRHPRDKPCAGMVAGRALRALARIGVEVRVPRVPVTTLSLGFRGGAVAARTAGLGCVVRRADFDRALAEEARRRGVEVREEVGVSAVETGRGGVLLRLSGGATLRARVVVGADGVGSVVRRSLRLPRRHGLARAMEVRTPAVASDPEPEVIHFDLQHRDLKGYLWDFPAPAAEDGERVVCRGVYCVEGGPSLRRRLERHLAAKGLDPGRFRPRQLAQRWLDPEAPISGPRVLLVGEAAGVDIATGEGIPQAIAYGAEAARYLAPRLQSGELDFADWRQRVCTSSLGRRLRVRHASTAVFHAHRPVMEELIQSTPAVLKLWARDFAGTRPSLTELLLAAWQTAPLALRHGPTLARALAALLPPARS